MQDFLKKTTQNILTHKKKSSMSSEKPSAMASFSNASLKIRHNYFIKKNAF